MAVRRQKRELKVDHDVPPSEAMLHYYDKQLSGRSLQTYSQFRKKITLWMEKRGIETLTEGLFMEYLAEFHSESRDKKVATQIMSKLRFWVTRGDIKLTTNWTTDPLLEGAMRGFNREAKLRSTIAGTIEQGMWESLKQSKTYRKLKGPSSNPRELWPLRERAQSERELGEWVRDFFKW